LKSYSYIFYVLKNTVKKANTEQNEHLALTEHTPQLCILPALHAVPINSALYAVPEAALTMCQ
jgi:hypothetical protein